MVIRKVFVNKVDFSKILQKKNYQIFVARAREVVRRMESFEMKSRKDYFHFLKKSSANVGDVDDMSINNFAFYANPLGPSAHTGTNSSGGMYT